MPTTLHAHQGDTLDALLWRERGLGPEALGPVLAANRGLAVLGEVLPVGTPVLLPETAASTPKTRPVTNLWD